MTRHPERTRLLIRCSVPDPHQAPLLTRLAAACVSDTLSVIAYAEETTPSSIKASTPRCGKIAFVGIGGLELMTSNV